VKRVAVTGIGAVTPLGNSFNSSWKAANNGVSGIEEITRFDASLLPWSVAGELKGFDAEEYLAPREVGRLDPFVHYAVAAALMSAEDAGLINSSEVRSQKSEGRTKGNSEFTIPDHFTSAGVIIGSSRGGIGTIEKALMRCAGSPSRHSLSGITPRLHRLSPYLMPATTISMAASYVAQKLGVRGYCLGLSNACASGSNAVGEAFRLIKSGYSPLIIAGGAEAPICRVCISGYGSSGALSARSKSSEGALDAPRPFDKKRDGFVLSEGACVLVLEEYDHALKRRAPVYGEIIGYGNCADAFHMTKPHPEGEARAMEMAMREARLSPDDIDYINAHGTGTKLGDQTEAQALRRVLGNKASKIPATALKSMTGHMLAASGALEIASTLMSMKEGIIPPTINLDEKDPECDINIITKKKKAGIRIALSNSFGFGGVNAVVALRKV
jgi:3-oxoacyl-[acyl-carrier-protein] synthase II